MNKSLEIIYNDYLEKPLNENQLETPEISNALESFFRTYFGHMPYKEYDKAYTKLIKIVSAYQENAFEVGFYTAVKLLTGGRQV